MAFDPEKSIVSVPRYNTDKIIGVLSGTLSLAAVISPSSNSSSSAAPDTGFGESCLYVGIYSTDNGTTWNDMGEQVPDLSNPLAPQFETVDVTASCSPTGIVTVRGVNWANTVTGNASAKTVLYHVFLLAKKGQGLISPLPITTLLLYHSSRFNYQKIYTEDTATLSVAAGATGSVPIAHNLGYEPNVRAWFIGRAGPGIISQITSAPEIRIDSSNLTFYLDNAFGGSTTWSIIYRIYVDG